MQDLYYNQLSILRNLVRLVSLIEIEPALKVIRATENMWQHEIQ